MKILFNSAMLIIAVFAVSCNNSKAKQEPKVQEPITYKLSEVRWLQPEKEISLPGNLDPYFVTKIFPKVKGFVKKVLVDRGSKVRKGQILAVVEAPELDAQLAEARAKVEQLQSNQVIDQTLYRRLLQTSKTVGAISAQELDAAHARVIADTSNVAAAQANLQMIKQMKDYLNVTAPFDGTITERNIANGDLVGPDEAAKIKPMFVIEQHDKLRLTVAIPEVYASALQPNQQVSFTVSAVPGKIFTAHLSRSSGSLEENIRSMMAEFDFVNPNQEVKSGMYAEVKLPIKRDAPTAFVPTKAVVNSTEKLFIITEHEGIATWVDVKKGISLDSLTEIFGNFKKDDKVISPASDEIKDGQKVRIAK